MKELRTVLYTQNNIRYYVTLTSTLLDCSIDDSHWYFSNQHFLYKTTVNPISIEQGLLYLKFKSATQSLTVSLLCYEQPTMQQFHRN